MWSTLMLAGTQQTLWLAPVVGAYLCLSSAGLLREGESERFAADLREHPGSLHAVGAVAFIVGAVLLSVHRNWATPPQVVMNLVALWWLFEGAGLLFDPGRLRALFAQERARRQLRVANLVSIPVGAYLLLVGLLGQTQ